MQYYVQGFNASNDPVATRAAATSRTPSTCPRDLRRRRPPPRAGAAQAVQRAPGRVPAGLPRLCGEPRRLRRGLREGRPVHEQRVRRRQVRREEGRRRRCEKDDECASGTCSRREVHGRQEEPRRGLRLERGVRERLLQGGKCSAGAGAESRRSSGSAQRSAGDLFLPGARRLPRGSRQGAPIEYVRVACVDPGSGARVPADAATAKSSRRDADQVEGGLKPATAAAREPRLRAEQEHAPRRARRLRVSTDRHRRVCPRAPRGALHVPRRQGRREQEGYRAHGLRRGGGRRFDAFVPVTVNGTRRQDRHGKRVFRPPVRSSSRLAAARASSSRAGWR